jgi:hypothetical protein
LALAFHVSGSFGSNPARRTVERRARDVVVDVVVARRGAHARAGVASECMI